MKAKIKKPNQFLHITELLRAFFETIWGFFFLIFSRRTDIGKGRVVMVIPGLLTSDIWTIILRKYLQKNGFIVYGWQMGINLGRMDTLPKIAEKIEHISRQHNQKIILIGWSMGGLFSRELSHQRPELISQVVTLASPFADVMAPNNARWVFEFLNKNYNIDQLMVTRLTTQTTMPSLAIYTKYDGIVPWSACMDVITNEEHFNVEVKSSHFGLGANPQVLKALINHL